jgi:ABC-type arginine transport system permease subunit
MSIVLLAFQAPFLLSGGLWLELLSLAYTAVVWPVVFGALTYAAAMASQGEAPSLRKSYGVALRRLGSLIWVDVIFFGGVLIRTITVVGIPWAISLFIRWFFGAQAVVLRGLGARDALRLSSRVVQEAWWPVFATVTVVALLGGLVWWGPVLLSWPFELRAAIFAVVTLSVPPLTACFYALLFLRLCERQGMQGAPT